MRHQVSTILFSQGWLGSELVNAANDIEKAGGDGTIAKQVLEQWQIIDEGLDDLIRENADLRRKLQLVQNALEL
jgi:hypothetical protein